ncbi:MAG: hypothetical protein AAF098_18510 [Pseudomonadota bacterium]
MEWLWVARRCALAVVGGYLLIVSGGAAFGALGEYAPWLSATQLEIFGSVVNYALFFTYAWWSLTASKLRPLVTTLLFLCGLAVLTVFAIGGEIL